MNAIDSEVTTGSWKVAAVLRFVALALVASACADDHSSGIRSECRSHCQARERRGCPGFTSACESVCEASYQTAEAMGSCSSKAIAHEDCKNSSAALELSCSTTDSEVQDLCAEQRSALRECRDAQ